MKVSQLIESLKYLDQDAEVHFSYNYGDHWRTEVAPKVSQVDEGLVAYSEYHRMDKIVEEEDSYMDEEPGNPDENVRRVVVIG
jgi:hypothetical protein